MSKRVEAPASPPKSGRADDTIPFHLLVQGVTDYAICLLVADGTINSWNAGAQRMTGYAADEIIGQNYSRFFTEKDRRLGLPQKALAAARQHARFEAEGWRLRKDGSKFWAGAILNAIHDDGGSFVGFAKITRDLTERRTVQDALLESERRFRTLVEGVVDYAIYMLDPSGIITDWNAGATRIKDYTAGEVIGRHFSCFYTPEERAAGLPAKSLETAAREGKYESEGWRVRRDGSRFFASVVVDAIRGDDGEILGFAKITRDITERRAAQEALRDSERHFRLLVGGVTDYALYMLDPNGIVSSWNAGAERIKGYTADEIIGHHFSRFYSDADRSAGVPTRALSTATRSGRYESEGWRVRKDGSFFWASAVIDTIRDEQGTLIGFAKITRDITERREAQVALQKMQARLAESQKLDALGQLTGGVAHDFNNLLMVVSGHIPTLKKLVGNDPRGARAAEAIEIAAQRGASLTRQLLTFSRRQAVHPSVISLGERIDAIREVLTSGLGSSRRLVTDIAAETWPVKVDVTEFEIALVNLVVNARDATRKDGTVTIAAGNVVHKPLDGPELPPGDYVALTVADRGVGIPEDVLGKIFDPFFTTKAVGKGTGLGLSQVHGFAHQAGGTVKVESIVGRGTRMTLYLPRADEVPVAREGKDEEIVRTGVGTVLLVEDNPDVASASAGLLEQLGCTVRWMANAEAALLALEDDTTIDLVFSDIVMPGRIDGLALARAIKNKRPELPVLLATGYSDAVQSAQDEFPILSKPFQIGELSRALAKVMTKRPRETSSTNLVPFKAATRRRTPGTDRADS